MPVTNQRIIKYKTDNNQYILRPLFLEQWKILAEQERIMDPVFSFDTDVPGLVNARKTFLEFEDPTGYLWAKKYLNNDFDHFNRLLKTSWFKPVFEDWLHELKMDLRVQALKTIKDIAFERIPSPPATILSAARYLAEAGWETKEVVSHGRGRPSKEELRGEMKKLAEAAQETEDDIKRIGGLSVIQGGKAQK